jgi:hypothetical protein
VVFRTLTGIGDHVNARLASTFRTVLEITDKALQNWAEQTEIDVAVLAGGDELRMNVEAQLEVNRLPADLLKTPMLRNIRRILAPAMKFYQFPSFAVIAPDGTQIRATR